MALTQKQKAFVAAFLGSARRDPHIAAIMAGMQVTKAGAKALVEHPEIRAELERRATHAVVIDGQLLDIEPGNLDPPKRPVRKGRNATRRTPHSASPPHKHTPGSHGTTPNFNAGSHPATTLAAPLPETPPSPSRPATTSDLADVSEKPVRGALAPPEVLAENGLPAGSLEETAERLERSLAARHLQSIKGSSPKLVEHLAKQFDETAEPFVARPTAEGKLAVVTPVKTRFELKMWLSHVVDGRLPVQDEPGGEVRWVAVTDVGARMQALALLGKSLGLFSEKVILDEYNRESRTVGEEAEEIRSEIESTRAEIARL